MVVRRVVSLVRGFRLWRRRQREIALIAASPLFDRAWYLTQNPDVAASGADPAAHYLAHGLAEHRNPSAGFDNMDYLRRYPDVVAGGMNPLLHYLRFGAKEGRKPGPGSRHALTETLTLDALRRDRFRELRPLRVFTAPPQPRPRLTLMTDSISRGSLFGGVGTAIMFAALLAQRLGASLRIVTQTEPADPAGVGTVLQANAIPWDENIEFAFTDRNAEADREIDLRAGDLFLTTSWWTTANAMAALAPRQIIYFLQEDERLFYPHGDEHLRCTELLCQPGLHIVVNSRLLHTHFAEQGFDTIARAAAWFEPAFPQLPLAAADEAPAAKHLFFFYARPWNSRNLFVRGVEAISAALEADVLDPAGWEFCFVGRDLDRTTLPRGVKPTILESLPWSDYAALVRRVDLGLSLMYTPHPSYPPLDLAAAGAVVVTNQYGSKTSLTQYSPNILCVPADIDSLVAGLADGAALALDLPRRRANHARNALGASWQQNFAPVLDRLAGALISP